MIILRCSKDRYRVHESEKILLQNFVKLVGSHKPCTAVWQDKRRRMTFNAGARAFCGFRNGLLYVSDTTKFISLSVIAADIASISLEEAGTTNARDYYSIRLSDGSVLNLTLL